MQEIIVPAGESAKKLENFLKKRFLIGYVRKLFRKNGVRINGRRAKADEPIRDGDRIQLYIPFEAQSAKPAEKSSLPKFEIIYEDDLLLVLNKPAGIAVHEGKTVLKRDTIEGVIERKYRASKFRPRLVHRLDKDTSGLLLLAKSESALAELETQFETGATGKEYLCLVAGRLRTNEGKIDFPLPGRDDTPKQPSFASQSKPAGCTKFVFTPPSSAIPLSWTISTATSISTNAFANSMA